MRTIAWLSTTVLALGIAGCGAGSGGNAGSAATTFSKSFGGAGFDEARAAIATSDGGHVFVGAVGGDSQGGSTDLWISKLDAVGNVEWQRAIGGRSAGDADRRRSFTIVRPTANGGTIVAGRAGDPPPRTSDPPPPSPTGVDLWIAKFNAAGLVEWQRDLDSGAWPGLAFAARTYGRGEFADDEATDVQTLPDGGHVVAGTSTANVTDAATGRVWVDAVSVFVARLDAQGQVVWQRRFGDDNRHVSKPVVRATADNGALLVFTGTFGEGVHMRIVRLDAAGNIAWQVDDENGDARSVLQTRDLGFVIAFDPFGDYSKLLRLGRDGGVRWSRSYGRASLEAVAERCLPLVSPQLTVCDLFAAGAMFVEGRPGDNILEPRGHVLHLSALGERITERVFDEAATLADLRLVGEAGPLLAIERSGGLAARRLVIDTATLQTQGASPSFAVSPSRPDIRIPTVQFASDTQILSAHDALQSWTWFEASDAPSDAVQAVRSVQVAQVGGDDDAVAVVEIEPGSFIVGGRSDSFDGGTGSHWLLRITAGQVDWQRRIEPAGGAVLSAMTRAIDGGVVIASGGDESHALRLIKLTPDGRIAWESPPIAGELQPRELHAVAGSGYVVVGDRVQSTGATPAAIVLRFDDAGRLLWQRDYAGMRGDSIEPVDDGFVVAGSGSGAATLARVMKLDAAGQVQWARSYGVAGASSASPHAAKVRQRRGGGYVLGMTDIAVIAPQQSGQVFGQGNVLLMHLDRDGAVVWTRSYGGLLDERLRDLQVLPDGGLLVAGGSDSLGERSEAWLMRLGADGLLAPGCQAHLGSLPVAAIASEPLNVRARELAASTAASTPATSVDTAAVAVTPRTQQARQCAGSANGDEPPVGVDRFALTIEQPGTRTGVVTSTPAALVCGTAASAPPCSASFPAGSDVVLAVEIGSVSNFLRWEDCDQLLAPDSGGAARCRMRMDRDRRVRAVFGQAQDRFQLRVSVAGTGSIRSSDEGIHCGAFYGGDADCEQLYERFIGGTQLATSITLAVFTHASGFQGWGGDCAAQGNATSFNLVMDADKHCTATFAGPPPTSFDLAVQKTGNGTGSIVSAPAGISCGDTCGASFAMGQTVRLLASEDAGSAFAGWSGCDRLAPSPTGSIPVCEVDMNATHSVSAAFKRPVGGGQYLLELTVIGQDGIVESSDRGLVCTASGPDCQELYAPGTPVHLSFNLLRSAGVFMGWGGDCAGFGTAPTPTLVMNGNKRCSARFSSPS